MQVGGDRPMRAMKRIPSWLCLPMLVLLASCAGRQDDPPALAGHERGARIYRTQCASCHGRAGEGVADRYDEALYGNRSVESLAGLIERTMPEEDPDRCVGDDAQAVAAYIHEAFYSPEARARNNPPRVELARLTIHQYRESVTDLIAGFKEVRQASTPGGLRAEYFQSEGMNKKKASVLKRTDPRIDFDFGDGSPADGITADQFSIAWAGSVLAPATGAYQFRVRTPNGARLYVNTDMAAGDSNRRDDSDAKRQTATVDLWVSSGGEPREGTAEVFLLGGRSYPLRLDYFKFKEAAASVRLEWKPPHGVWQVIPPEFLSPENSSSLPVIGTTFPPDDASFGYERGTAVSRAWHEATTKGAVAAAAYVEGHLGTLADAGEGATNRLERLHAFAVEFAGRAFRRPLTPELRAALIDPQFTPGTAPEVAIRRAVLVVLTSPRFLYPDLHPDADPHSIAGRLALALWDSLPDAALREAADRGELADPDTVRTHARRLVADPRARAKLRRFFDHWLALEEGEDVSKDAKAYPDFDEQVLADFRHSLERFVEEVVWSGSSDYRQLLLADHLYLNPRLARFFGKEAPEGDDFVPVRFDPAERAGILTHPYLLSALSYHRSTSPIHRGVFLTRNVLGRFLKPPPMAIEFMDDRFDPSLTMREKVSELTGKPACMSCHATINPLGFSLEHYDAVGRYRTEDNAKPVDAEADYLTEDGRMIRLRGPRDLAEHAATSVEARRGFVRQLFQQTLKQAPAAYGSDTLERLDTAFVADGHHIRNLLVEIALTASLHPSTPGASAIAQAQP